MLDWNAHRVNCVHSESGVTSTTIDSLVQQNVPEMQAGKIVLYIGLSADQILDEVLVVYANQNKIELAFNLAKTSARPEHYTQVVFSVLLNKSTDEDDARALDHLLTAVTSQEFVQN